MKKLKPGSILRCKCAVVGDATVGKTSIINALLGYPHSFSKKYNMTKGVNIFTKLIKPINCKDQVELYLYDFAGNVIYQQLIEKLWSSSIKLIVAIFDISREESLEYLQQFFAHFLKNVKKSSLTGIILGNKSDLNHQRVVNSQDIHQWAKNYQMRYFDVSAKENVSINEAFQHLASTWIESTKDNSIKLKE